MVTKNIYTYLDFSMEYFFFIRSRLYFHIVIFFHLNKGNDET